MKKASTATLFAIKEGRAYALTVQRANTKKWKQKVMFGSAESRETGETARQALHRGLKEELGLGPKAVKKVIAVGQAKPEKEHLGYKAQFFLVEIPYKRLEYLAGRINQDPGRFHELRNARLTSLRMLGRNAKALQPHYRAALPAIKHRLGREAAARREAAKRRRRK